MAAHTTPGRSAEKPAEFNAAVSASNAFGLELYRRLAAAGEQNVFISPYSIMNALSMTAAGARERTAAEMHNVLHFPEGPEQVHAGLSALNRRFASAGDSPDTRKTKQELQRSQDELAAIRSRLQSTLDWRDRETVAVEERHVVDRINALLAKIDPTEIEIANALWAEKTYPLARGYLSTVSAYYGAGPFQQADFRTNFEAERRRINDWIEGKTRQRIQELLPPGSLNNLARLVLTNAIYFKGEWASPFEEPATRDEDFSLASGQKIRVPLMRRSALTNARYGAFNADGTFFNTPVKVKRTRPDDTSPCYPGEGGFAIVELRYQGDKLAMVVIAPDRPDGLPAIESRLDSKTLAGWLGELRQRECDVYLPRFKSGTAYDLNGTLIAMGMKSAFRPESADFSGMTDSADPNDRLYVGLVRHKASVDVNEKGTEAAAATAVAMPTLSALPTIPFMPVFRADRPFLYLIRDVESGCLMFVGRVMRP